MIGFEQHAYLQIITGPMGSGKTEELVEIARKIEKYSKYDCQAFKPLIDERYSNSKIVSRNNDTFPATMVNHENPNEIISNLNSKIDIILIEEANFFDKSLTDVVKILLENDKKILVSGLDLDFRGNPFGPMGHLLSLANQVIKKQAFCEYSNGIGEKCGEIATRTQRILNGGPAPYSDPLIIVGDGNEKDNRLYQARCPRHHIVPR